MDFATFGDHPYKREVRHALALVREIGAFLEENYDKERRGVGEKEDDPTNLVCDDDLQASRIMLEWYNLYFPNYGIVEEESGRDERDPNVRCWLGDGLDGSHGYIHKEAGDERKKKNHAVLITLLDKSIPVVGVSFKPGKDELICAVKGQGAYIQYDGREPEPIEVSSSGQLNLVHGRRTPDTLTAVLQQVKADNILKMSGSAKFLEVAKGDTNSMNNYPITCGYHPPENITKLWDIGPSAVIVPEANGGIITDARGEPISFSKPGTTHSEGIVVANSKTLHERMVAAHASVYDRE